MENGSVQPVRSEQELQYGRADRLAIGAQRNEARHVGAMTEIALRLVCVGKAVAAREPAWTLKTG